MDGLTPLELCRLLADDTRLRLVALLAADDERCVCDLTTALQLSQPKISRHLALLRGAGLLQDRRQGQWVYYRLHPQLPEWAQCSLEPLLAAQRALEPARPLAASCC